MSIGTLRTDARAAVAVRTDMAETFPGEVGPFRRNRRRYDDGWLATKIIDPIYATLPALSSMEHRMARIVRGGLIQATLCEPATSSVAKIKQAMNDKHEALLAKAVDKGAQIVCFQELFHGPYFCAEQQTKWYELVERVPDGPTVKRFADLA